MAIKKVANAFEDMIDAKRMLREVRLMRQFNHPNVVKLYGVEVLESEVKICTEYVEFSLRVWSRFPRF